MNLSTLEILTQIVASACHDVGHPGVSNNFLCGTGDKIAIQYNDQHVLENFHCSLALGFLNQEKNNFLAETPRFTYKTKKHSWKLRKLPISICNQYLFYIIREVKGQFRRLFIKTILATDLAEHGIYLERFRKTLSHDGFNFDDVKDRHFALQMAIKVYWHARIVCLLLMQTCLWPNLYLLI